MVKKKKEKTKCPIVGDDCDSVAVKWFQIEISCGFAVCIWSQ